MTAGERWSPPILHAAVAAQRAIAVPPGLPTDILARLAAVVAEHSARLGLVVDPRPMIANEMRLPEDDRCVALDLTPPYWREVAAPARLQDGAIMATAIAMLEAFADRNGPGRVWTLGGEPLVHFISDDGVRWFRTHVPGVWACRLRMLAAHEASAR